MKGTEERARESKKANSIFNNFPLFLHSVPQVSCFGNTLFLSTSFCIGYLVLRNKLQSSLGKWWVRGGGDLFPWILKAADAELVSVNGIVQLALHIPKCGIPKLGMWRAGCTLHLIDESSDCICWAVFLQFASRTGEGQGHGWRGGDYLCLLEELLILYQASQGVLHSAGRLSRVTK